MNARKPVSLVIIALFGTAAAGQSVLAHLIKLESEGRAVRRIDAAGQEHWTIG